MKFLPRFARQLRIDALERRLRREAARAAALPGTLFRLMTRGLDAAGGGVARRGPVAWMHSLSGRPRGVDLRGADTDVLQILALQSGDPHRIRAVLDPGNPLTPAIVAQTIPLLGSDLVGRDALRALRAVAAQHTGTLVDALVDDTHAPEVRSRIPQVLAAAPSGRTVAGLLLGLNAGSPAVRRRCGKALLVIRERRPDLRIDERVVLDAVGRELEASGGDIAHVFTLLSLVLPRKAVGAAYRGVRSDDPQLRGTALEYLQNVLPAGIREGLLVRLDRDRGGS